MPCADPQTTALLRCGMAAGPFFIAAFTAAGALRSSYNPVRHPVSSLALTGEGWMQIATFIVAGLLMLAFAAGVRSVLRESGKAGAKPWLVGAYGLGLVGAGVFLSDPVSGYPPGTPDELSYSWHGILHDAFSALVFLGMPLAGIAFALWFFRRRRLGWGAYSLVSAVVFFAAFILASLGFDQQPGWVDTGGLFQRAAIVVGSAWFTLLAVHLNTLAGKTHQAQDAG